MAALTLFNAPTAAQTFTPERSRELERPLRFAPDADDFVITNGEEFFNRPPYVTHTAFRADGGDRPEWSLYLPGRGGQPRARARLGRDSGRAPAARGSEPSRPLSHRPAFAGSDVV